MGNCVVETPPRESDSALTLCSNFYTVVSFVQRCSSKEMKSSRVPLLESCWKGCIFCKLLLPKTYAVAGKYWVCGEYWILWLLGNWEFWVTRGYWEKEAEATSWQLNLSNSLVSISRRTVVINAGSGTGLQSSHPHTRSPKPVLSLNQKGKHL